MKYTVTLQTYKNVCNFPNLNLFLDLLKILADVKI